MLACRAAICSRLHFSAAGQHAAEFGPVDVAEHPVPVGRLEPQIWIRNGQPDDTAACGTVASTNFLPQFVVGEAFDLPAHRCVGVLRVAVGRAEHHQHRPPPAIQRVLRHRLLLRRALAQRYHDLEALALVEALFLADTDHRPRIGTVRAPTQRDLVHDCGAVDKPADGADIRPAQCRVVEDRGIFCASVEQLLDQVLPRHAQRFGGGVEVEAVAALVLHLGEQRRLAPQAGRAGDPVALRKHADDLGMRVLADLADQRAAIGGGHPVVGFDARLSVDARLELRLERGLGVGRVRTCWLCRVQCLSAWLGIHGAARAGWKGCAAPIVPAAASVRRQDPSWSAWRGFITDRPAGGRRGQGLRRVPGGGLGRRADQGGTAGVWRRLRCAGGLPLPPGASPVRRVLR